MESKNFEGVNNLERGPDDLSEHINVHSGASEAELAYYSTDVKNEAVDISEEALFSLSPLERRQRRYAHAAGFYHEADRLMMENKEPKRVTELRNKSKELYDKADALYEKETAGLPTEKEEAIADKSSETTITIEGGDIKYDGPVHVSHGASDSQIEEAVKEIDERMSGKQPKKPAVYANEQEEIDALAQQAMLPQGSILENAALEEAAQSAEVAERELKGVRPQFQPAAEAPEPVAKKGIFSKIKSWFGR